MKQFAILSLALVAGLSPAGADEVGEVVARYTEAVGGLEAIRAIEAVRKSGIYVYNGLEHPVVVVQKEGAGCREEIDGLTEWGTARQAGTKVVRAYDGHTAWVGTQTDHLETTIMPEGEAAGFVLDADIEAPLIDFSTKGISLELVGPTEVDGIDTIRLLARHADGTEEDWYLDAESYLPVMRSTQVPDGDFKAAQTWYYDDYREVAGVRMPFYVQIEERLFSREYIFDGIEVNPPLEADFFARPAVTEVPEKR